MSQSALSILFEYISYGATAIINILIFIVRGAGDRLYTSESDVYRRQILTYKDDPRADRVKVQVMSIYSRFQYIHSRKMA